MSKATDLNEQYKWDNKLEIFPSRSSWEAKVHQSSGKVMATNSSVKDLIPFAFILYDDHKETEFTRYPEMPLKLDDLTNLEKNLAEATRNPESPQPRPTLWSRFPNGLSKNKRRLWSFFKKTGDQGKLTTEDTFKIGEIPEEFEFLAQATNKSAENGYYGVAYIQRGKKQIILSHGGEKMFDSETQAADLMGFGLKSKIPQASSAMTFAHQVSLFAQESGCELFVTGNSLGGWLAQITCFSAKFLTVNDDTGQFEANPVDKWAELPPSTVVFDSPRALQFLQKMKDDIFPQSESHSKEVSVSCLPIKEHQFHPNNENKSNTELRLEKERRWVTQVESNGFPSYFHTTEEFEFLKDLKNKSRKGGSYEGLSLEQEVGANNLVAYCKGSRELLENETIEINDTVKNREVISLVSQVYCNLKKGNIWWNPKIKSRLPTNHIQKRVCKSTKRTRFRNFSFTPESSALHEINEDFVLFVGDAGTGRSLAVTDMEQNLRKNIPNNRIIIRINLNDVQKELETIPGECRISLIVKLASFLPLKTLQMKGTSVFVLLDGLDEASPRNQVTIIHLLRILLAKEPNHNQDFKLKVILKTRRHLRDLIESEFKVESWSLTPLSHKDQIDFIQAELGTTGEESSFRYGGRQRYQNPRMLFMLVDFLKSGGSISAIRNQNMYGFYAQYFGAKHKPMLFKTESFRAHIKNQVHSAQQLDFFNCVPCSVMRTDAFKELRHEPFSKLQIETMLSRNFPFYFHVALNQLLRGESAEGTLEHFLSPAFTDSIRSVAMEPPSGLVETRLLNFGLLVLNNVGKLVFKHKIFAEFFYATLIVQPETPKVVKDTLIRYIYKLPHVLDNVQEFISTSNGYTFL